MGGVTVSKSEYDRIYRTIWASEEVVARCDAKESVWCRMVQSPSSPPISDHKCKRLLDGIVLHFYKLVLIA